MSSADSPFELCAVGRLIVGARSSAEADAVRGVLDRGVALAGAAAGLVGVAAGAVVAAGARAAAGLVGVAAAAVAVAGAGAAVVRTVLATVLASSAQAVCAAVRGANAAAPAAIAARLVRRWETLARALTQGRTLDIAG